MSEPLSQLTDRLYRFLLTALGVMLWSLSGEGAQLPPGLAAEHLSHKSWSLDQGLPVERIKDIVQTRDGYLWLGTPLGIARFDGVRFTVFNHENVAAFKSDDCWTLAADEDDVLWIATPDGVVTFHNGEFHAFGVSDGLADGFIGTMVVGRRTGTWVGTMGGLSRYHEGQWTTYRIQPGGLKARVLRLHEDPTGKLWVGTVAGLQTLDPVTGTFSSDLPHHADETEQVYGIHVDAAGTAWVLYRNSNQGTFRLVSLRDGQARVESAKSFNRNGDGWLAAPDGTSGFWHVPEQWQAWQWFNGERTNTLRLPVPPNDDVISLLEDREGSLWLGTLNSGLHRLQIDRAPISRLSDGLPSAEVWAVLEDLQGDVWLGTDRGLVRKKGDRLTTFTTTEGLSDNYVRALALDAQGRLWIGTTSGLDVFEHDALRHVAIPGSALAGKVRAILWAKDQSLWIGTDAGVFRFDAGRWTELTEAEGLENARAPVLVEDHAGDIWIGTVETGLYRWRQGKLTHFTKTQGLPGDQITSLYVDRQGVLWVGTDQGIGLFEGDTFKLTMTQKDGPITTVARSLVEDDTGFFWIECAGGLYGAKREDLIGATGRVPEQSITRFDGSWKLQPSVPKSFPNGWKTRDGRILFGSMQGLLIVDPRHYLRARLAPPVVIEQVIASGETLYCNAPIGFDGQPTPTRALGRAPLRVPPGRGYLLEFHFTEPTSLGADKIQFRYKLSGADPDWITAGSRRAAYYTGLSPGTYRFRVCAGDGYTEWPSSAALLDFAVLPLFYQTRWFQSTVVLLVGAALYGVVGWRVKEWRRRNKLQKSLAVTHERNRLARDLHDQLGSELARASHLAESLDATDGEEASAHRSRLSESLRAMRQEIDAAVWAIAPDKDNLGGLLDFTVDRTQRLLEGTELDLDIELPQSNFSLPLPPEFRHQLATAVLEAVGNALRHAQARHLRLTFTIASSWLTAEIADDGCGMQQPELDSAPSATCTPSRSSHGEASLPSPPMARVTRNGACNMHARINALGGTMTVESAPGQGTRVQFRVPLPKSEPDHDSPR